MDIMALCNSAINFILYCSMSRQFRTTFNILFRPKFLDRWLPLPQGEDGFTRTHAGKPDNGHTTQVTQVQQSVRRPSRGHNSCIRALLSLCQRTPSTSIAANVTVINNNLPSPGSNRRCATALQCRFGHVITNKLLQVNGLWNLKSVYSLKCHLRKKNVKYINQFVAKVRRLQEIQNILQ